MGPPPDGAQRSSCRPTRLCCQLPRPRSCHAPPDATLTSACLPDSLHLHRYRAAQRLVSPCERDARPPPLQPGVRGANIQAGFVSRNYQGLLLSAGEGAVGAALRNVTFSHISVMQVRAGRSVAAAPLPRSASTALLACEWRMSPLSLSIQDLPRQSLRTAVPSQAQSQMPKSALSCSKCRATSILSCSARPPHQRRCLTA